PRRHPTPPALPAVAASISPAPSYLAVAAHRSLTRTSTPPCALTLVVGPAACARNGLKRLGGGRRSWVRVDGATGASEARQAHADLPPRVRPPPLRSALRLPLRILCNLERIREDEEKGSSGTVERACFKELFDIDLKNSRVIFMFILNGWRSAWVRASEAVEVTKLALMLITSPRATSPTPPRFGRECAIIVCNLERTCRCRAELPQRAAFFLDNSEEMKCKPKRGKRFFLLANIGERTAAQQGHPLGDDGRENEEKVSGQVAERESILILGLHFYQNRAAILPQSGYSSTGIRGSTI
ncbi:hypothetical protein EJB05_55313, partial [Eragrostis curvula]